MSVYSTMFLDLSDFWYRKVNLYSPAIDQSAIVSLKALKPADSSSTPTGRAKARASTMADKPEGGNGGDPGGGDGGGGDDGQCKFDGEFLSTLPSV